MPWPGGPWAAGGYAIGQGRPQPSPAGPSLPLSALAGQGRPTLSRPRHHLLCSAREEEDEGPRVQIEENTRGEVNSRDLGE